MLLVSRRCLLAWFSASTTTTRIAKAPFGVMPVVMVTSRPASSRTAALAAIEEPAVITRPEMHSGNALTIPRDSGLGSVGMRWSSSSSSSGNEYGVVVDLATPDQIRAALAEEDTVILDVRTVDEVLQHGYFQSRSQQQSSSPSSLSRHQLVFAPTSVQDASLLAVAAKSMIRNKHVPIIVYCGIGVRAQVAKQELERQGYSRVLNAGGLVHLRPFQGEHDTSS